MSNSYIVAQHGPWLINGRGLGYDMTFRVNSNEVSTVMYVINTRIVTLR